MMDNLVEHFFKAVARSANREAIANLRQHLAGNPIDVVSKVDNELIVKVASVSSAASGGGEDGETPHCTVLQKIDLGILCLRQANEMLYLGGSF